jgi:hypothetical protein
VRPFFPLPPLSLVEVGPKVRLAEDGWRWPPLPLPLREWNDDWCRGEWKSVSTEADAPEILLAVVVVVAAEIATDAARRRCRGNIFLLSLLFRRSFKCATELGLNFVEEG